MNATTLNSFSGKFLLYGLFTVVFLSTLEMSAQNFSGLENKQLNKLDDIGAVGVSLFAERIKGKIESVIVTYDSERKLKLALEFTEFSEHNYTLIAELKNAQKLRQAEFQQIKVDLNGKQSPIELEFNLDENTPEGTELTSAFLEIRIGSKSLKPIFLYNLNKNWKTEINAENLIVPVSLEPIGSAANLKATSQKIIIPKRKPNLKYSIDKSKLVTLKQPLLMTTTSSTSTVSNTIDGTWINDNKNTKGITKVIISNKGKNVQVYGKCSPKDCDWGRKRLVPKRNSANTYWGIFDTSIAKSTFMFTINTNKMEARHVRDYKSPSRPTKRSVEKFTKLNLFIARPMVVSTTGTTSPSTSQPEPEGTTPQGPDNTPISLWDDLVADHDFEFPYEITNVRMDIYPDKNPASGTFYYLPSAYHLRWNTDEGYDFSMLYGTADSSSSSGNVRMTGTLTPGISSKEIALIKSLLESYIEGNPNYSFTELKIMPINTVPAISLSSGLEGQYNISSDQINVTVSSSIREPIDISWMTSNTDKDDMQTVLSAGDGIKGSMTLTPASETVPEQLIPVRITLADSRTLGKFILEPNKWRNENWVNNTPFPLRLKKVHALIIEKQGTNTIPIIYTWDLNNVEIPSKAKVQFDASKMPKWVETQSKTKQIWLDYAIVDCTECVNKTIDELTDGTSGSKVKHISFESFQLFSDTDIAFLQVKARSKYIDPKGTNILESEPVRITEDNKSFALGPLYIPEGETPQFEYFFTLVMNDGTTHQSDNWLSHEELFMFIGIAKLKENISSFNTED
ncbi:hypothetical protein [Flavivirga spongiicola]|uniref:Uncharacterized protein n=1 Tax=Flavivirga spongiicola TaxID=421621 RepID=A0ABU7XMQ1_9FLAO|nr:hypothetical protein [Flavivirga sp. MEBiC05379]MDO5981470.1 hypothetical protein [Flavivirga sp. MEBiC05379]